MNKILHQKLISVAKERLSRDDIAHDFNHAMRVLLNAEKIMKGEKGDSNIIIPAALFHDIITYPKDHPNKNKAQEESAIETEKILNSLKIFKKEQIDKIKTCILECSFNKGIKPKLLESKIIQDADLLESIGALGIMRVFAVTGQMKRPLYYFEDPFGKKHELDAENYALDHFYTKLLFVKDRINTKTARKIAIRRTKFLKLFLEELALEFKGK
jgi:uncharacterized protein